MGLLTADGDPTSIARLPPERLRICGFVALYWGIRLCLQYGVLNPKGLLKGPVLKIGYHCLTLAFAFFTGVFGWAAFLVADS